MIKGSRRQMVVMRTGGSKYFDEAYFVLRRGWQEPKHGRDEILTEANRILEEGIGAATAIPRKKLRWLWFLAGIFCGALLSAGILLLCFL